MRERNRYANLNENLMLHRTGALAPSIGDDERSQLNEQTRLLMDILHELQSR